MCPDNDLICDAAVLSRGGVPMHRSGLQALGGRSANVGCCVGGSGLVWGAV